MTASANLQNNFENPVLTSFVITARSVIFHYTRFGNPVKFFPAPATLAGYLKELNLIEGFDECSETGRVNVLYTTDHTWADDEGNVYHVQGYDGYPLRRWLAEEMNEKVAQSLINHHENAKDSAMLKTHLDETVKALRLMGGNSI
jgi:hypothetical protein